MRKGLCILMIGCLLLSVAACGDAAPTDETIATTVTTTVPTTTPSPGENMDALCLTGRVIEVAAADEAMLLECSGDCPLGSRVWVQYGRVSGLNPQVGQTYIVTYEDMVMPSLPPRITAVSVTAAE